MAVPILPSHAMKNIAYWPSLRNTKATDANAFGATSMSTPNFLRMALCGIAALAYAGPAVAASADTASPEAARLDSYIKADGAGYFALSLSPSVKLAQPAAHDVVVLFDTSASQAGAYRTKAHQALDALVAALGEKDRVHLMAVDLHANPITPEFVAVGSASLRTAVEALKQRVPLGSTDMTAVFQAVSDSYPAKIKTPRAVVYIGDGMSTAGMLDVSEFNTLVGQLVKRRIPVSAYAIGPRLDTHLLAAIANQTGGNLGVDNDKIDAKEAGVFLASSARGAVVWPTRVEWPKVFTAVYPKQVPPLRTDRDTIVLGKGKGSGSVNVTMTADEGGKPIK